MSKVSIIVPVYNSEEYLKKCIESLINQTYKNIEIILIDDGSTDASGNICEAYSKYDARIKVFHNENHGPAYSRNFGIDKATGDYITFVDCDDWLDKQAIEILIFKIDIEGADVIFFNLRKIKNDIIEEYKMFDENVIIFCGEKKKQLENILLIPEKYTDKTIVGLAGSVCKLYRSTVLKNCIFPEELSYAEDYCFIAQVIKRAEKIIYIDNVLYNYLIRKNSLSHDFRGELVDKNTRFVNWFINFYRKEKTFEILNEFVYRNYCLIISNVIIDKKLCRSEKKQQIHKFLADISFDYDFSRVDLRCKNRNLRLEWFLIHKRLFLLVYLFNELARIKNGE